MRTYFDGLFRPSQLLIVASATLALGVAACSSDSKSSPGTSDAGTGGTTGSTGGTTGSTGGTKATGGTTGSTGGQGGTGGKTEVDAGDGGDGCVPESLVKPDVPDALKVPSGVTLVHEYHAKGIQTYKCTATTEPVVDGGPDGGAISYAWGGPTHASTPTATLSDGCGVAIVHHSAGPKWTSLADGSSVAGTKVAAAAQSGTIPWLLLTGVASNEADGAVGLLSKVTYIQRLATVGGAAPADGCDEEHVNTTVDVDYTANYYFYTGP